MIFQGNPSGATNSNELLYFGSAHIAGGGGRGEGCSIPAPCEMIGSLSNHDDDGNKNPTNLHI